MSKDKIKIYDKILEKLDSTKVKNK